MVVVVVVCVCVCVYCCSSTTGAAPVRRSARSSSACLPSALCPLPSALCPLPSCTRSQLMLLELSATLGLSASNPGCTRCACARAPIYPRPRLLQATGLGCWARRCRCWCHSTACRWWRRPATRRWTAAASHPPTCPRWGPGLSNVVLACFLGLVLLLSELSPITGGWASLRHWLGRRMPHRSGPCWRNGCVSLWPVHIQVYDI